MGKTGLRTKQINKVFQSNLMYYITAAGFIIVCMVGLIMNVSPLELLVIAILGGSFFYIFAIILVTNLIANVEKEDATQQSKYARTVYRYNLLTWRLRSKMVQRKIDEFKEEKEKERAEKE